MMDPLLSHFQSQWRLVRALTDDLLHALSEEELHASPGGGLGAWWKQFRHVGRVQENYLDVLESGTVRFGFPGTTYAGGCSKREIGNYLERLDQRLQTILSRGLPHLAIDWFGASKSAGQHLLCLVDHETLHHGQWIVYRKLLGGSFPRSWSIWGV